MDSSRTKELVGFWGRDTLSPLQGLSYPIRGRAAATAARVRSADSGPPGAAPEQLS